MEIDSLVSDVIPTMIVAWLSLLFTIWFILSGRNGVRWLSNLAKAASDPSIKSTSFSPSTFGRRWYSNFKRNWLAAPNNISLAVKSAWRARERGLAIFAGVFLS